MAVQAPHLLSHAFLPHDLSHAAFRALEGAAVGGGVGGSTFLDELGFGGCAPAFVDAPPRSELTCNGGGDFLPRKRARQAAAFADAQHAMAAPLPLAPAPPQAQFLAVDVPSRCGGASTSGRAAAAATGATVLSQLYHQGAAEVDALVRVETERLRLALREASRRHARAVASAAERAAAPLLRAAEAELERARCRNAELEERLRQLAAEGQAWLGVARSHEAVAARLRATLEQLLQQPALAAGSGGGEADAEDAQSCCFDTSPSPFPAAAEDGAASGAAAGVAPSCKSCGAGDACVLLLPCRHLCLCRACDAAAEACPVCAATKNASLQVLLS